jgi:hypothetical protein
MGWEISVQISPTGNIVLSVGILEFYAKSFLVVSLSSYFVHCAIDLNKNMANKMWRTKNNISITKARVLLACSS